MTALRSESVDDKTLKKAEDIDQLDPKDAARSYKELALGTGILQDKADRIAGKPSDVIEHR